MIGNLRRQEDVRKLHDYKDTPAPKKKDKQYFYKLRKLIGNSGNGDNV